MNDANLTGVTAQPVGSIFAAGVSGIFAFFNLLWQHKEQLVSFTAGIIAIIAGVIAIRSGLSSIRANRARLVLLEQEIEDYKLCHGCLIGEPPEVCPLPRDKQPPHCPKRKAYE